MYCVEPSRRFHSPAGAFYSGRPVWPFGQPIGRYQFGNACVRLRSDFHNFIKLENASFRRCSEKSAFSGFIQFENHLARPNLRIFKLIPPGRLRQMAIQVCSVYRKGSLQLVCPNLRISKLISPGRLCQMAIQVCFGYRKGSLR